jgi:hypothetical protein
LSVSSVLRLLSVPPNKEIWWRSKAALLRMLSLTPMEGSVRAARVPVVGREHVAEFIAAFSSHYWKRITLSWIEVDVQGSILLSRFREPAGLVTTVHPYKASIRSCGS